VPPALAKDAREGGHRGTNEAELRGVQKVVQRVTRELGRVREENGYVVDYLLGQKAPEEVKEGEVDVTIVMDDTTEKGEVGGTTAVGDDGEDEEDEWTGFD
jgi:hypothetical protein